MRVVSKVFENLTIFGYSITIGVHLYLIDNARSLEKATVMTCDEEVLARDILHLLVF